MADIVHRLRIPTSLPIRESNAYLIEGDPLTLLDPGTFTEKSAETLGDEVSAAGHRLEGIQRIVITHAHVDHFGLAAYVRKATGAEVCLSRIEMEFVEEYPRIFDERTGVFGEEFRLAGVPDDVKAEIETFFGYLRDLAEPCKIDTALSDGDFVQAGSLRLQAVHTPGHSDGSMCFLSDDGSLFSGDTLMRDVSWNFTFGGMDLPASGLADYTRSLERLSTMDIKKVYPGHLRPFDNPARTIDEFRAIQEKRESDALNALRGSRLTAYEVAGEVYGLEDEQDAILSLSQVLGLLEKLIKNGQVVRDDQEIPRVFTSA
jgi:glyoxylase-like metal-dependent hydrolase (beta-lactamase superfamily II)